MSHTPFNHAASGALKPRTNYRWSICALLFFGTAINYVDRQILGVLKGTLSHDLRWSEIDYANIVTAFQFAYAFGYLFGGRLMDKVGIKRGYPAAATVWSVAAAVHGLVNSVFGFITARLFLGAAEGCNFPAAIRVISDWFPIKDRALATGVFNSAANVGAIVCPLSIPFVAVYLGWRFAFIFTGMLGLIWVLVWTMRYESPESHPALTVEERNYIQGERVVLVDAHIPWLTLLKMKAAWAYTIASALTGMVWWFYIFWFPGFVQSHFHCSTVQAGLYTGVVYTISLIGSIGGGYTALALMERGLSLDRARKVALLIPAVCALPVFYAAKFQNVWATVIIVGVAAASHQAFSANLYTLASDLMPKRTISTLVGMGGFVSGMASIGMAQVVGYVLQAKIGYTPIFAGAAPMYVIAVLAIQILIPTIEQHGSPGLAGQNDPLFSPNVEVME
jgi:MFS transporter, ACS family, hexuronate transporter